MRIPTSDFLYRTNFLTTSEFQIGRVHSSYYIIFIHIDLCFIGKFCVIHYEDELSYSPLKNISELNKERIRQAKNEHEKQPANNKHYEQCQSIPETIDADLHSIHSDPCYKKFTRILAGITKNKPDNRRSSSRSSAGSSSNTNVAWLFPDGCYFCKKIRVQIKGKKVIPTLITTTDAVESIKAAAFAKNAEWYREVKDVCLIAKEFKAHYHCYRDFTRGYTRKDRECPTVENVVSPLYVTSKCLSFRLIFPMRLIP